MELPLARAKILARLPVILVPGVGDVHGGYGRRFAFGRKRRCLVIADGWYEWQRLGSEKQPYLYQFLDQRPFAFAGAWERWDKGDKPLETCTILTTNAADFAADVHDRMPLVLDPAVYDRWLDTTLQEPERITPLMTAYGADDFERIPVSDYVNNPRHEGPQCAKAIG